MKKANQGEFYTKEFNKTTKVEWTSVSLRQYRKGNKEP